MKTKLVYCELRAFKRIKVRLMALTLGFACLYPLAALCQAQDQNNQGEKKDKGVQQHSGKGVPHAASGAQGVRNVASPSEKVRKPSNKINSAPQRQANVSRVPNTSASLRNNARVVNSQPLMPQDTRSGNRTRYSQRAQNQVQFMQPQGNRANRYGGRWIAADAHADWGNSGEHYWNHRHYRWYDGGWLIISPGYAPGYGTGSSVGADVQQTLAAQGYYNGPIDGDIGPRSRRAIANY